MKTQEEAKRDLKRAMKINKATHKLEKANKAFAKALEKFQMACGTETFTFMDSQKRKHIA